MEVNPYYIGLGFFAGCLLVVVIVCLHEYINIRSMARKYSTGFNHISRALQRNAENYERAKTMEDIDKCNKEMKNIANDLGEINRSIRLK